MRKNCLDTLSLDLYKLSYLDCLDDKEMESLEKWIDSDEPEDDLREIMFYTVLKKSTFKALLDMEKIIPQGIDHMIIKFLEDLEREDPYAVNWFNKYVAEQLKKAVNAAENQGKYDRDLKKKIVQTKEYKLLISEAIKEMPYFAENMVANMSSKNIEMLYHLLKK